MATYARYFVDDHQGLLWAIDTNTSLVAQAKKDYPTNLNLIEHLDMALRIWKLELETAIQKFFREHQLDEKEYNRVEFRESIEYTYKDLCDREYR